MNHSLMRERIADSQARQQAWGTEGGFKGFFHNGKQIASPDEVMATNDEDELNSLLSANMSSSSSGNKSANDVEKDLEELLTGLFGRGITRQGGNY